MSELSKIFEWLLKSVPADIAAVKSLLVLEPAALALVKDVTDAFAKYHAATAKVA